MIEHCLPASPFSATGKRYSEGGDDGCGDDEGDDVDDDDDVVEFKSLLSVYDDKSGTSVGEVKRFSATKIKK